MVRDTAGLVVRARRMIERGLIVAVLAVVVRTERVIVIVAVVVIVEGDEGPVGGVRVIAAVVGEVQVRQHLHAEEPQRAGHQREGAALTLAVAPIHRRLYYEPAGRADRRAGLTREKSSR